MRSKRYWSQLTNESFFSWVEEQDANWACVTFKGRKRPAKVKHRDEKLIQEGAISFDSLTKSISKKDIEKGFTKTVRRLDFNYLTRSRRKNGEKIRRIPFIGGDVKAGVWNHIHALIEIPLGLSLSEFRVVLNKHFNVEMVTACGDIKGKHLETDVWCELYRPNENKLLSYCVRPETDSEKLGVKFDKVILNQLVLTPPKAVKVGH